MAHKRVTVSLEQQIETSVHFEYTIVLTGLLTHVQVFQCLRPTLYVPLQELFVFSVKSFDLYPLFCSDNPVFEHAITILEGAEVEAMLTMSRRRFESVDWTELDCEAALIS